MAEGEGRHARASRELRAERAADAGDDVLWGGDPDATDASTEDDAAGLTVLTPSGGTTALGGQSTTDDPDAGAPVSASYAATGTKSDTSSQADTYATIRAEIAGALGVDESSTAVDDAYRDLAVESREAAEEARVAEGQRIRDDALANGRREETVIRDGDLEARSFKEFVPGEFGGIEDARVRLGTEIVHEGIFSDTVERTTNYFDGMDKVGIVVSEITDGVETVTQVLEYRPGAIDLKPGDTRDIPADLKTAAGLAPSTWDPKADGSLGRSRPNEKPTTTQTGDSPSSSSSSPPDSSSSSPPDSSSDSSSGPAAALLSPASAIAMPMSSTPNTALCVIHSADTISGFASPRCT